MRLRHETEDERIQRLHSWHEWFAWRPVYVGPGDLRWLERVRRRRWFDHTPGMRSTRWDYEPVVYRDPAGDPPRGR